MHLARLHRAAVFYAPALLSLGSAAVLAVALVFEHAFGYRPCQLCYWQRLPYYVGLLLFLPLLLSGPRSGRIVLPAAAALFVAGAGLAGFHVGVEYGWWSGPATCAAAARLPSDPQAALEVLLASPLVRCDEVAWSFAGLSMAGWNGIISLAFAAFAGYAWREQRRIYRAADPREKRSSKAAAGR